MAQLLSLLDDVAPQRAPRTRNRRNGAPPREMPKETATDAGDDLFIAAGIAAADQAPEETARERLDQFRALYRDEGNRTYGVWDHDLPAELRPFVPRFVRQGWCSRAQHCTDLVILDPELRIPNDLAALLEQCREEMLQAPDMNGLYRIRDSYESRYRDEFTHSPFWDAWAAAIVERGPAWYLDQENRRRGRRGGRTLFGSTAAHRRVMERLVSVEGTVSERVAFVRSLRHGYRWHHETRGTGLQVWDIGEYSPNTFVLPLVARAVEEGDVQSVGALLEQVFTVPYGGYGSDKSEARLRGGCVLPYTVHGRPCKGVGGPRAGRALLLKTCDGAILVPAPHPVKRSAAGTARKTPRAASAVDEIKTYAKEHGIADLAWVTVPVSDCNFPGREKLAAMGREALEYALPRVTTHGAKRRIEAALRLIARADEKARSAGQTAKPSQTSRRRASAQQEPDFGLDVAPGVPGLPEFMRAAVDWPRLHGQRVWFEIKAPGVEAKFPVAVAVRAEGITRPRVSCGIDHEMGLGDWVYEDGRLYPVVRRHQHQPKFTILPPEVAKEVAVIPEPAPGWDGSAKRWPSKLSGNANGTECDWQPALNATVGCAVAVNVPTNGAAGVGPYACSAAFILREWCVDDGWLTLAGDHGTFAKVLCNPSGARLFAGVDKTYYLVDGWHPDGGYAGIHVQRAH